MSCELDGKRIGPYEILGVIGRGGMGVIYKARDRALDRIVALKFLPAGAAADEQARKRFLREARSLASLDHPNITSVYSVGKAEGSYYIACQFVSGRTLLNLLRERGPFPVRASLRIVREVADALEATHTRGIIHRDIKTENIMIDEGGRVKVLDFGLAKSMEGALRITHSDVYLGTPEYCSPEQLRGEDLDGRSDLYSLGVVLYELLAGELPFHHEETSNLYQRILKGKFAPLRRIRPEVPPEVDELVRALMDRRREHRLESASEAICAIDSVLLGLEPSSAAEQGSEAGGADGRPGKPARRRGQGILTMFFGIAAALLLPAAVIVAGLLRR